MTRFTKVLLAAIVVTTLLGVRPTIAQETLTYVDLVNRMIDLGHPAVLPEPGEKCAQWSSYDRASKYDPETGKYVAWGANNDGPQFIRKEGDQIVMAEMEGPGCIWRIWSARALKGHVKIYLDGSDKPAVDLPFENYFSGDTAPFDYPMLSYNLAELGCRGQNLYFPIPYQKSCKVVADEGWGRYYQFTYMTYPKGTKVPTFTGEPDAQSLDALKKVNAFLQDRLGTDPAGRRKGQEAVAKTVSAAAGKTATVAELTGPRAITAVRVKMELKNRDDEMAALRRLVLQITFDGQSQPAVWCPLGDFFGTAPGVNPYKCLATGMTKDGFYAYWYMPFAAAACMELVNQDKVDRQVKIEVVHAPLGRPFEGLGHFHCKWHRDIFPLPEDRWPDWTMLRTEGRGRFCGVMLHVWNPRGGWWGEGDEKFFVDGEKFPSTIGTGSEDYFGYAWCNPGLFQRPFHCQTMTQANKGHQSVLRWHIVDNVPFQKSFEGCIEKYYRTSERGTQYACTACWYLAPDGVDPIDPLPVDQRDGYYENPPLTAGGFKVLGTPKGTVRTQGMSHFSGGKWKNDEHLWWTGAKPGDKLDLVLPVKKSGQQKLSVVLTKARDYGIVQFHLDGKKTGDEIDLYNPDVVPTEPILLGTFDLDQGDHKLTVEIVGANEKALKKYMFGIDYVVFEVLR